MEGVDQLFSLSVHADVMRLVRFPSPTYREPRHSSFPGRKFHPLSGPSGLMSPWLAPTSNSSDA